MIKLVLLIVLISITQSNAILRSDALNSDQTSPESRTISGLSLKNPVNLSCLDLLNYWTQLFNEFYLKPLPISRRQLPVFGDVAIVYRSLVSVLNFFQITINDLRSQLSGLECTAEQFTVCNSVDKVLPKKKFLNVLVSQLNFYLGSNHGYNPLYALWNSGFLAYQCICRTC